MQNKTGIAEIEIAMKATYVVYPATHEEPCDVETKKIFLIDSAGNEHEITEDEIEKLPEPFYGIFNGLLDSTLEEATDDDEEDEPRE